jgi:DNA-binding transcriptional regulator YiaG
MKSTTCKHIHRIKQNGAQNRPRISQRERSLTGARFKVMCADAGLSIEETAKVLHVTTRTVRYWISGRVGIPYAAYRLVRILGRFELPDPTWAGWSMHSGRLWSPEGHGFVPGDSNWWGLLVSQARLWREQYERGRQFDLLMLRAGRAAPCPAGDALASPAGAARCAPNGAAGRAAQPPGLNLLKEHISTAPLRGALAAGGSTEEKTPQNHVPAHSHDVENEGGAS